VGFEETRDSGAWWTDSERAASFLSLLEARRGLAEQAMWQAPTVTIAAQAFLLVVLTDDTVSGVARFWILVAGVAACLAAILSLIRLRAREILYSEGLAAACETAGVPDPRPHELERKPIAALHRADRIDRGVQALARWSHLPAAYLFWIGVLVLFVVADVVAYGATR
jgi:hypothetical protein